MARVGTRYHEQAFVTMKEIKHMFDPNGLLNRNRLYGRI